MFCFNNPSVVLPKMLLALIPLIHEFGRKIFAQKVEDYQGHLHHPDRKWMKVFFNVFRNYIHQLKRQ